MENIFCKKTTLLLVLMLVFGCSASVSSAQTSPSVLYVPLIGITSVPDPFALPEGGGRVKYSYAVKNFIEDVALTDVQVVDDRCSLIEFSEGDDNNDSKLDYSETWRYTCSTIVYETTQSIATATGFANDITAVHKAYTTVNVGSDILPPLVSIINITKVAYPLSLPSGGGDITFTYKVNNPGQVPLKDVLVVDNKCSAISSRLGDTNSNNQLDVNEVWIYTCTARLTQTTTNTVEVTAFANGLKASGQATVTVVVDIPVFPDTGVNLSVKVMIWLVLGVILIVLLVIFVYSRRAYNTKNE